MAEWRAALGLEDNVPACWDKEVVSKGGGRNQLHDDSPASLEGVPRLQPDLVAFTELFDAKEPVHCLVQGD